MTPGPRRRAAVPGRAPFLSDLPFRAPAGASGRAAVLGTWCIVLSFPLPWASSPFLGWFAAWGFNPTPNLIPFGIALLAAVGTITPSRVPERLRVGHAPFAAGTAGLGLAWGASAYLGTVGVGLWLLAAGAVLAGAGGLATLLTEDRRDS